MLVEVMIYLEIPVSSRVKMKDGPRNQTLEYDLWMWIK